MGCNSYIKYQQNYEAYSLAKRAVYPFYQRKTNNLSIILFFKIGRIIDFISRPFIIISIELNNNSLTDEIFTTGRIVAKRYTLVYQLLRI
jgi:hypothetical protein